MLKATNEKIHLSVNVEPSYFMILDKITPIEALEVVKFCLKGNKQVLDTIITSYKDNGNPEAMFYLSEIIDAGIENGKQ